MASCMLGKYFTNKLCPWPLNFLNFILRAGLDPHSLILCLLLILMKVFALFLWNSKSEGWLFADREEKHAFLLLLLSILFYFWHGIFCVIQVVLKFMVILSWIPEFEDYMCRPLHQLILASEFTKDV